MDEATQIPITKLSTLLALVAKSITKEIAFFFYLLHGMLALPSSSAMNLNASNSFSRAIVTSVRCTLTELKNLAHRRLSTRARPRTH